MRGKVRDVYESKFEYDLDPLYAMRSVSEGNFTAHNDYTWSADKKTLYAKVSKSTMPAPVDTAFHSNETIRDIINMIYSLRAADINSIVAGKPVSMLIAMDRNLTRATCSFVRKEVRQIDGMGKFNTVCLAMNLKRVGGDFPQGETKLTVPTGEDSKNTIYIWLSDDENRVPLYLSVPISVGKLEIRTTKLENLKAPLTSKVK